MKLRAEKKVAKYRREGNLKKQRKYERALWAIVGMDDKKLNFNAVLSVFDRYERLDLVPSGYFYYEFLRI